MNLSRIFSLVSIAAVMPSAACSSTSKGGSSRADGGDSGGAGGLAGAGGGSGAAGALGSGGSSGVGGSSGSNGAGSCADACDAIAAANCPGAQPHATCVAECGPSATECPSELAAFASCVSGPGVVSCDAAGDPNLAGCDESSLRLAACSACLVDSSDDACSTCQKTNCCSETKAYFASADILDFSECLLACATQQCLTGCQNSYPIAGAAFDRITDCAVTACVTECSGP